MFFLNLSAAEFFTLLGAFGGLITALYLLDQAKRRKVVSTLQFWVHAGGAEQQRARRRIRDPWSLILQLASLLLLLLAISRVEWGSRGRIGRDHVILIDDSSWSGGHISGNTAGLVIDREKDQARRYLSTLPPNDRVMLIAADSLATPLTRFIANRRELNDALDGIVPGFSALGVNTALSIARQAQNLSSGRAGEIVYTGPQMINDDALSAGPPDRILAVTADRENCGIRQLTVQQVEGQANTWQALVQVMNDGEQRHTLRLAMHYGGTAFATRRIPLAAREEATAEYTFTTRTPGELTAQIEPADSLASDNEASVFLPKTDFLRVAVYTDRPEVLRPLLAANHQITASFFAPGRYTARPSADVLVIDRFAAAQAPAVPALWIDPPREHSPLPVEGVVSDALLSWNSNGSLASALHAKQLRITQATTFQVFDEDETIASVPDGPVVIVRQDNGAHEKSAVIGFDAAAGPLRFEVATPLLFADLLQQLNPLAFRTLTFTSERVGLVHLTLDGSERIADVQVTDDKGFRIPFSKRGNVLELFSGRPATIHVVSGNRERVVALRLPNVADHLWQPAGSIAHGLPGLGQFAPPAIDLWKWLALAGGGLLLLEWFLFGRLRRARAVHKSTREGSRSVEREPELVAR